MSTHLKTLLAFATTIIFHIKSSAHPVLRSVSPVLRRSLISSSSSDPEAAAVAVFTVVSNKNPVVVDWRQVTVTFCFCSAVALSVVPAQVLHESPISFRVMPVLIALTISFLFMSDVILAKYPSTARVLEFIWKLSVGATLFTALCIPLPTTLNGIGISQLEFKGGVRDSYNWGRPSEVTAECQIPGLKITVGNWCLTAVMKDASVQVPNTTSVNQVSFCETLCCFEKFGMQFGDMSKLSSRVWDGTRE